MQTRNTHCHFFQCLISDISLGRSLMVFPCPSSWNSCMWKWNWSSMFSTNVPARFLHVDIWHLNLIFPQSIFEMRNVLQGIQDWDIKSLWSSKQRIVAPGWSISNICMTWYTLIPKPNDVVIFPHENTLYDTHHPLIWWPSRNQRRKCSTVVTKHNYVVSCKIRWKSFQTDIYCKGLQLSNDCWCTACIDGAYFFCCQPIPKVGNAGSKLVYNNAAYPSLAVEFETCIWIDMHNRHRPLTNTPRLPMRDAVSQHWQHKG